MTPNKPMTAAAEAGTWVGTAKPLLELVAGAAAVVFAAEEGAAPPVVVAAPSTVDPFTTCAGNVVTTADPFAAVRVVMIPSVPLAVMVLFGVVCVALYTPARSELMSDSAFAIRLE